MGYSVYETKYFFACQWARKENSWWFALQWGLLFDTGESYLSDESAYVQEKVEKDYKLCDGLFRKNFVFAISLENSPKKKKIQQNQQNGYVT